jgi:competence protein ComEC
MNGVALPQNFSRFPLLWLSLSFASGVTAAHYLRTDVILFLIVGAAVVGSVIRSARGVLILSLFLTLGSVCYWIEHAGIDEDRVRRIYESGRLSSGELVELEGVLFGPPEPSHGGAILCIRAQRITFQEIAFDVSGNVRLFVVIADETAERNFEMLDLAHGSGVTVYVRLMREEQFQNPGVASRVEILDRQGFDATATLKSPLLIEKVREESVFLPLAWIFDQRRRAISGFRETFSAQTSGVMIASLLGDQHFLDRETAEVFREGGTFHVLVISGLHITFIGALSVWLLSFLTVREAPRMLFAALFLWSYTLAVGAGVPLVRASLMFTALLFSRIVYRSGSLLNSFGLSALVLLIWRPSDLFSPSFQLTITSVAAIVGCSFPLIEKLRAIGAWMPTADSPFPSNVSTPLRRCCELLYWNNAVWEIESARQVWSAGLFKAPYLRRFIRPGLQRVTGYLFEGILVSLVVQIWMLPLLIIYFHRVSPVSILLNIWVGIFLALESFSAVIALGVSSLSPTLAAPLIGLAELLNWSMIQVSGSFASGEIASFRLPIYPGPMGPIYAVFGLFVITSAITLFRWETFRLMPSSKGLKMRSAAPFAAVLAIGIVIILHPGSAPQADGKLKIDFLDVGQGDAALVTFPDGRTMLVDGGGRPDYRADGETFQPDIPRIGESVVSEFLWERGYSHVDFLVATHADTDHIQGLRDVAQNFGIGSVLVGRMATQDPDFAELYNAARSGETPITIIGSGDEFNIGGATIQIFNPPKEEVQSERSNNSSIVMKISFGARSFLLTGDVEREAESSLATYYTRDLQSDVIKVAHHGSRTSSIETFVRAVSPDMAVISVGRRSRFGHPHPEVVEQWQKAGAKVITTGEKGTITIIDLHTFVP